MLNQIDHGRFGNSFEWLLLLEHMIEIPEFETPKFETPSFSVLPILHLAGCRPDEIAMIC